ncbi:MAG: epimerase [Gemmatimonadaceae bacterium]
MNVLLFGATGMVGDGVLHQCLIDPGVTSVLAIGRSPLGVKHVKLRERRRADFFTYADLTHELATIDACFFCLGVSSAGMNEASYHRQTFDLTLAAARALAAARPRATFCYVSGEGTDSSERGRSMWARVKGKTENALVALPLNAYMFRPGFIRPRPGVRSKTRLYRMLYPVLGPLYPVLKRLAPNHVTTAENIGRAMIAVAAVGYPKRVLENPDINTLGAA